MSRKRGKKQRAVVAAIPEDILAEGSGPVAADAIATVEDVATTDDIATTDDVVTADDVVATASADADPTSVDDADPIAADDAEPLLARPHDSNIVTAAELAEAMETAGIDDVELAADTEAPDADTEAADADTDAALDANGDGLDPIEGDVGEGDEDDADGVIVFPTSAATMDAVQLKHLVEALIFASDRPLTVPRLRQLTRVGDVRRLEQALVQITEDYQERGLILQQVSGGYQFRTRTQFSAWVQQLIAGRPVRLSRAQLETLAIIAYRQPITRPEIDDIRGVDSSATLKLLIDRMLIRVLGKREEVGRPMLYGTTKEFLDFFSLGDLRELPTLREYSELTAESRKVMSDRLGIPADGSGTSGGSSGGTSGGSGPPGGADGGGSTGGDDGGDAGGSGAGAGGSSGGPVPGLDDGGLPDDGGTPAHASADDLGDAMATFLAAADAVDRSDAAALSEPDRHEPDADVESDALQTSALEDVLESEANVPDALESEAIAPEALEADAVEADAVEADAVEAAPLEAEAVEASPLEAEAGEAASQGTEAVELVAHEADAVAVDAVDHDGGWVDDNAGWPAGSQRIAVSDQPHMPVIAPNDDRPVERPVMDSNVIGAGAPDGKHGDAAPAAGHGEPAAE